MLRANRMLMFICDLRKIDDLLDHLDRYVENRVYTRFSRPRLCDRDVLGFATAPLVQQEPDATDLVRAVVFHLV